jgi:hypothetical protein
MGNDVTGERVMPRKNPELPQPVAKKPEGEAEKP